MEKAWRWPNGSEDIGKYRTMTCSCIPRLPNSTGESSLLTSVIYIRTALCRGAGFGGRGGYTICQKYALAPERARPTKARGSSQLPAPSFLALTSTPITEHHQTRFTTLHLPAGDAYSIPLTWSNLCAPIQIEHCNGHYGPQPANTCATRKPSHDSKLPTLPQPSPHSTG